MAERQHFWHTSVFLWRKKNAAIRYSFPSGLHWGNYAGNSCVPVEVLESHCLENATKPVFFFSLCVPVFAGKSLDGWQESEKREKQILKAGKKWQSTHWSLEVVNTVVREEER